MTDEEARIREKIEKLKRLAHNNANFNEAQAALNKVGELENKLANMEYQREIDIIDGVKAIADRYYGIADRLMEAVNKCRLRGNTKGLEEMVAYSFNSQGIDPRYGGGGGLPVGKHPVTITKTEAKPTKDNTGGMIVFTLTAFDGPAKGGSMDDRLNVHNKSQDAVRIANQQLAAYCAVTGVFHFQNTDELCGKPFIIEVAQQVGDPRYVEIVGLFDMNGNEPGKAGSGPMSGGAPNGGFPGAGGAGGGQIPPAQDGGQGGAQWGGQPAGGGASFGGNAGGQPQGGGFQGGQPQGDPNAGNGGQQWGGQPQGGGAPQGGGNPQWGGAGAAGGPGGQPQGGQPQGGQGGAQGDPGGWQQGGGGAGGGGGQPGWGQR